MPRDRSLILRSDPAENRLAKLNRLILRVLALEETPPGGAAGVASFNTRAGAVTLASGDVTGALGFTPSATGHTHDDRYYTDAEVDTLLAGKQAAGSYQPSDSDLTAIAALTTTAFGRSLLEAADAAAMRTLAGLVIGANVQAQNALLSLIAALSDPGADKMLFWDESANAFAWLEPAANLSISGTDLDASGGGGSAWSTVKKTADTATASDATPNADPHLFVALGVGTHRVFVSLLFESNATADFNYNLSFSGTTTALRHVTTQTNHGAVAGTDIETVRNGIALPDFTVLATSTGVGRIEMDLSITVSVAGTLTLNWSQNTSNAVAATVFAGSYIDHMQVV